MEISLSEQPKVLLASFKGSTQHKSPPQKATYASARVHLCSLPFKCRWGPVAFSIACWSSLQLTVPNSEDPCFIFESFRTQLHLSFFMEIIITMSWSIWTMRNDVIFRGISHSIQRCKASPTYWLMASTWPSLFLISFLETVPVLVIDCLTKFQ
jgi:hypothetical protein